MGYKSLSLKLHTHFTHDELRKIIAKVLRITQFSFRILSQSLDARKKDDIHWVLNVGITSTALKGPAPELPPTLKIPFLVRNKKVVVVGSGPAGFFSALVLQKAGFSVTILERGQDVDTRAKSIETFEGGGTFNPAGNYAFGEGGAGTFSDGKLTSRSKHIAKERQFILSSYIDAGAPEEIAYLAHPHLGSDKLRVIVKKMRQEFQTLGGKIQFETTLEKLTVIDGKVTQAVTSKGGVDGDIFVIAPGHSAYDTYRMLIGLGVKFQTKSFAIGSRVEHPQELINKAQWGQPSLLGVLAAEYRLTSTSLNNLPVYTFCMCPGGIVVPATAFAKQSSVNGMSLHKRDGAFANAGCVAAINLDVLLEKETTPIEALDWIENLERQFWAATTKYKIPACNIDDFIQQKLSTKKIESSYPLGLKPMPLWELLPEKVSTSLRAGLLDFSRKIKGFESGTIMGLESKTSSPIQALRDENLRCEGFSNLYLAGEGSGHSGGIISSAADGVKVALEIIA